MLVCFTPADNPPFAGVAFNRLAAWVTGGPYCHCEVAFKDVKLSTLRDMHTSLERLTKKNPNPSSERSKGYARAKLALDQVFTFFEPNTPSDHNIEYLAFHALQGEPLGVRVLSRYFDEPFYQPYSEKWKVYFFNDATFPIVYGQLLWSLSKVGLPYNTLGALWSPMASPSKDVEIDPDTWWCSNLCLRFLQNMALCQNLSLCNSTPNNLAAALKEIYINTQEGSSENSTLEFSLGENHWKSIESFHPYVVQNVGR